MQYLFSLLFLLAPVVSVAQSSLPPCPQSAYKSNCFGSAQYGGGIYLGEWKDGQPHGIGKLNKNGEESGGVWAYGFISEPIDLEVLNMRLLPYQARQTNAQASRLNQDRSALEQEINVVKIGHVAPTSGVIAHLGKDNENGARLAIEELNSRNLIIGGRRVKFELVPEDDAADPKQAIAVAQRLVDAKVNGVIGHLNSGTSILASRIYRDAGIPQISPSATNPKYTRQGFKTTFRLLSDDIMMGNLLGAYAVNQLKGQRIAVIDDRTVYGTLLAENFEKAVKATGGHVVGREFTTDTATDFKAILTTLKAKNPDIIFFGGMDTVAVPMIKQMKALGINARFMGGDGICTSLLSSIAGADNKIICAEAGGVDQGNQQSIQDFNRAFQKRFNAEVKLYAPYTYDAVMVMVAAMQAANSVKPTEYLSRLADINYQGITGAISFDEKGDIKNGMLTLFSYRNGNRFQLQPISNSTMTAQRSSSDPLRVERDQLAAEADSARKRQQELEQLLAQERAEKDRLAALMANQASAPQRTSPLTTGRNERRVALIVGNSKYAYNPLDNPVNDATDLDAALKNLGFKTTLLRDANIAQMRNATRQFANDVATSDVALIFYAGHGIEAKGRNYLIPVSADIKHEYELEDQAYDAGRWLDMLENIKGTNKQRVNIVILDACRNNDLSRGWRSASRGLARMDAPTGTFIAFATAPGKVAMDGAKGQRNSPFTKNLLRTIQTPDLPIELMFKEVRRQVLEDTKNEQVPWDNSSLVGDFVFKRSR